MNEKTETSQNEGFFKKHNTKLSEILNKSEKIKREKLFILAENKIFSIKIQKEIDAHQKTIENLQGLIVDLDHRAAKFDNLHREKIDLEELIPKKKWNLLKIQEENKKMELENKEFTIILNKTHFEISKFVAEINQENRKIIDLSGLTVEEREKRDIIFYQQQILEMDEEIRLEILKEKKIREIINKNEHEPYKINKENKKTNLMNKKDFCFNYRKLNKKKIQY